MVVEGIGAKLLKKDLDGSELIVYFLGVILDSINKISDFSENTPIYLEAFDN